MEYKNSKIYQILNHVDDAVYIGSTTQPLCKRMAYHRRDMTKIRHFNRPVYEKMRELGVENFYIELIEEYPCESKEQLTKREGHYIRQFGTLNKVIAGRTHKEYVADNYEDIRQYKHEHYEQHKERVKCRVKEYSEHNADRIKEYQRQYRLKHKDSAAEYNKEYRQKHRDKINEQKRQYKQKLKDQPPNVEHLATNATA